MCERLKQAVLKTALPERVTGVRIPLPPPYGRVTAMKLWRRFPRTPRRSQCVEPGNAGTSRRKDGLLNQLKQNGLAEQVQSWVGPGTNQAVSPEQVQQGLGTSILQNICATRGHFSTGRKRSHCGGSSPCCLTLLQRRSGPTARGACRSGFPDLREQSLGPGNDPNRVCTPNKMQIPCI
jgi:hypothetical protein